LKDESIKIIKKHLKYRQKWEITSYEGNLKSKSGKLIPVYLSWTPLPNWGSAGIMTDLRNIKSLEEIKNELSIQIKALNNSAIVLELDENFNVSFLNNYFKNIFWFNIEFFNFSYLDSDDTFLDDIFYVKKIVSNWNIWQWEIRLKNNLWEYFYFSTSITPFTDEFWKIYKIILIWVDVTEIRELNYIKDEFLNISSHELRTPLTAIRWYLSMLLDGDAWKLSKEIKLYISKAFMSATNMLDIINSMLDLAKLKSWKMTFNDVDISINDLLKYVNDEYKIMFKDKNIKFILDLPLPLQNFLIYWDSIRIKQVIANLLSNSYKFTNSWWKVILKLEDLWNKLRISVEDNWIWIPDSFKDKIFDKFTQVENSLQRKSNWTGIWLNISKLILEHYNT